MIVFVPWTDQRQNICKKLRKASETLERVVGLKCLCKKIRKIPATNSDVVKVSLVLLICDPVGFKRPKSAITIQ